MAYLVDRGARIVARLVDGITSLYLAAARGDPKMFRILLEKSEANEEEEAEKGAQKKASTNHNQNKTADDMELLKASGDDSDGMNVDENEASSDGDSTAMKDGSFVQIRGKEDAGTRTIPDDAESNEPDIYEVNIVAWDILISTHHRAGKICFILCFCSGKRWIQHEPRT